MKDRVPRYPGRVRLEPVQGQSNIFDMVMMDDPVEEGTPPTKAYLLTDDTANLLGLSANNATVNNALQSLIGVLNKKFYTTAGTYVFIVPKNGNYVVEVIGGGGGGSGANFGGGGGGYALKLLNLTAGTNVSITVGAGALQNIEAGGASSFGGYLTAPGGNGSNGGIPTEGDIIIPGGNGMGNSWYGGSFFSAWSGTISGTRGGAINSNYGKGGHQGEATAKAGCVVITWI